ncbi:MAG: hypothetical protein U0361_22790 [Nitrospiraceae bacterium]
MGRTVGYQYDALHRLSTITAPDGGVTIYTYDVNNRLTTITDPRGITYLTTLYYPSGLVAKQILADGGTYRFEYTLAGSTITQAKVTDPRGNPTTYTFNNYQFVSQIDAPGQTTQFQLQSSTNYLTQVTDALGRPPPIPTTATGMWPRSPIRKTIRRRLSMMRPTAGSRRLPMR